MTIPSEGTPLINGVSATTTSVGVSVERQEALAIQFTATGISAGNGVLTLQASIDGVNWYGISFVDSASTTTTTAITSKTLTSNTTFIGLIPMNGMKYLRAVLTFTTDGVYTVWLNGQLKKGA